MTSAFHLAGREPIPAHARIFIGCTAAWLASLVAIIWTMPGLQPVAITFLIGLIGGAFLVPIGHKINRFVYQSDPSKTEKRETAVLYTGYAIITIGVAIVSGLTAPKEHLLAALPPSMALGALPLTDLPMHKYASVIANATITIIVFLIFDLLWNTGLIFSHETPSEPLKHLCFKYAVLLLFIVVETKCSALASAYAWGFSRSAMFVGRVGRLCRRIANRLTRLRLCRRITNGLTRLQAIAMSLQEEVKGNNRLNTSNTSETKDKEHDQHSIDHRDV